MAATGLLGVAAVGSLGSVVAAAALAAASVVLWLGALAFAAGR